jgi:hypothetical protein
MVSSMALHINTSYTTIVFSSIFILLVPVFTLSPLNIMPIPIALYDGAHGLPIANATDIYGTLQREGQVSNHSRLVEEK